MLLLTVALYCVTSDEKLGSSFPGLIRNLARLALSILRYYRNVLEVWARVAHWQIKNYFEAEHARIGSLPLLVCWH